MKPLNILMVTSLPDIRALKEAFALKLRGHTIALLCRSHNKGWDACASTIVEYQSDDAFVDALKILAPQADIIHCHNGPNSPVAITRAEIKNIPVIYDCHDFASRYRALAEPELLCEKLCFETCDAVIHVSSGMCRQAESVYTPKKSLVLYNFPSQQGMPFTPRTLFSGNHVAYEGSITHDPDSEYNARYYLPYFKRLGQSKIHVHAFPTEHASADNRKAYTHNVDRFLHLNATLEYKELLHQVSSSTWGFTGFYRTENEPPQKALYLDNAMPHKLFEYLYVGVTPIVIHCREAANFVTEHNVGYAVESMEEFANVVKNAPPLAHNIDLRLIDMDVQIEKLEALYADLLGVNR